VLFQTLSPVSVQTLPFLMHVFQRLQTQFECGGF
jgi:hypothetical protein